MNSLRVAALFLPLFILRATADSICPPDLDSKLPDMNAIERLLHPTPSPSLFIVETTPPFIEKGKPIAADYLLFVTHPYSYWDSLSTAKVGINKLVSLQKIKHRPVVYLVDSKEDGLKKIYLQDQRPNSLLFSPTGDFDNPLLGSHFLVSGGNWTFCLSRTVGSILKNSVAAEIEITIATDASFSLQGTRNLRDDLRQFSNEDRIQATRGEILSIKNQYKPESVCVKVYDEEKLILDEGSACKRKAVIFFKSSPSL